MAVDAWLLGVEAALVLALRSARLAGGGAAARAEARLMITEKLDSNAQLCAAMLTGGLGATPQALIGGTVRHYLKGVRANRKRLMRR